MNCESSSTSECQSCFDAVSTQLVIAGSASVHSGHVQAAPSQRQIWEDSFPVRWQT